jgi:glycogen synthase
MRILLCSHLYAPSVGGIETMSRLLAAAWAARGHEARVVTTTPAGTEDAEEPGWAVLRNPSASALAGAVRWCDVCFHNNISLGRAWPLVFVRRPWVVAHQTWLTRPDGRVGWRESVKRQVLRAASSVAISRAVAEALPVGAEVIPNAYDDAVFFPGADAAPRGDLIFAGRLVSDKGVDLLLTALARLAARGTRPGLTVVGDGPERGRLERMTRETGLEAQVRFAGVKRGAELAAEYRAHRILVVPSRWAEPFGIVALEGAACGCRVVGSSAGGLPEAIGPCGRTFANGDADALARALATELAGAADDAGARRAHLARHGGGAVAEAYLRVFARAMGGET